MRPEPDSQEAAVLQSLRDHGHTAVVIEILVKHESFEGKERDLGRAIGNLRRMGFEILAWQEPPRKNGRIYAYQLKREAKAEDPYEYLLSILGKSREVVIKQPHHRIRLCRYEHDGEELVTVGLFHSRKPKADNFEHYVIGKRGVVSFDWDEVVSGAELFTPVMDIRRFGSDPTVEERMLIDLIRAQLVQLYVQRALEKYGIQ